MAISEIGKWKVRYLLIALPLLLCPVSSAYAEISVGIGLPGISIGINMPAYPQLIQVPGSSNFQCWAAHIWC